MRIKHIEMMKENCHGRASWLPMLVRLDQEGDPDVNHPGIDIRLGQTDFIETWIELGWLSIRVPVPQVCSGLFPPEGVQGIAG